MHPLLLAALILIAIAVFGIVASRLTKTHPTPHTVDIAAPRPRVLTVLERLGELPRWYSNIEEAEPASGPNAYLLRWRDATDRVVRVDDSAAPERIVWSYAVEPKMGEEPSATGRWTFTLEDLGAETRVSIDVHEDEHSAGFQLFQMVRGRSADADLFLEELKERVEHPEETPPEPGSDHA